MELGRVVAAGPCQVLLEKEDVKDFYLGAASAQAEGDQGKQRWRRRKTWR
jgi:hypothetical protein